MKYYVNVHTGNKCIAKRIQVGFITSVVVNELSDGYQIELYDFKKELLGKINFLTSREALKFIDVHFPEMDG